MSSIFHTNHSAGVNQQPTGLKAIAAMSEQLLVAHVQTC